MYSFSVIFLKRLVHQHKEVWWLLPDYKTPVLHFYPTKCSLAWHGSRVLAYRTEPSIKKCRTPLSTIVASCLFVCFIYILVLRMLNKVKRQRWPFRFNHYASCNIKQSARVNIATTACLLVKRLKQTRHQDILIRNTKAYQASVLT